MRESKLTAMEPLDDDELDCPLCMEKLDEMDRNFKPCVCGYQVCRFAAHTGGRAHLTRIASPRFVNFAGTTLGKS